MPPDEPPPFAEPIALAGYVIERELGRGGMGIVYKARQKRLNRAVALKMVRSAESADPAQLVRFLAEAEVIAKIDHPNVVKVYEFGDYLGVPYFSLEYCPNGSLADHLKGRRHSPEWAARVVEQVARGVQAAHAAGIIHRDLKPGNVLMAADNTLKVTDFGLAKQGAASGLTDLGIAIGTPRYMAPEQASGQTDLGPTADVYSLGAILYECLTGVPPFQGPTPNETLRLVLTTSPIPIRDLAPQVPLELCAICEQCMAKKPQQRYPSAQAVAEALRAWRKGDKEGDGPASTFPLRRLPRSRLRWSVTVWLALVCGALFTCLVVALVAFAVVRAERDGLREALATAVRSTGPRPAQVPLDVKQALAEERSRWTQQLIEPLASALEPGHDERWVRAILKAIPPEQRWYEWYYLERKAQNPRPPWPQRGAVASVAFSADGKLLASVGDEAELLVRTLADGKTAFDVGKLPARARCVAFSADNQHWATGHEDHTVRVWHQSTGQLLHTLTGHTQSITALAFSGDGTRLVSASADGTIRWWTPRAGTVSETPPVTHQGAVLSVAFSPDGNQLLTGSRDRTMRLWDTNTGQLLGTYPHETAVYAVAFSPNGQRVASGSDDQVVRLWTLTAGEQVWQAKGHTGAVQSLTFSPDGQRLASGSADHNVRLWDTRTGRCVLTLTGHAGPVTAVVFHPSGMLLASASADGSVRLW
jgi:tRNA A-37 threonylcarbamoyl transferase component Bud32